jgi:hypothetical protein
MHATVGQPGHLLIFGVMGLWGIWPPEVASKVFMLTSQQPIWIGWGRELIYLYNDPYKSIIGGKASACAGSADLSGLEGNLGRHRPPAR